MRRRGNDEDARRGAPGNERRKIDRHRRIQRDGERLAPPATGRIWPTVTLTVAAAEVPPGPVAA